MAVAQYLAWIDLESTGLDEKLDPILEIGLVVTKTTPPCEEVASYTAVVRPADSTWVDRMDTYVTRMHTSNNLLADIERVGRPLREVENEILALLMTVGRPHTFMLAGSGVSHYDRRFIKAQMPGLDKWLQYPSLDVGTLRRALKFCGRSDLDAFGQTFAEGEKPHRGLSDVRDHLNEYRQYATIIESIPKEG